MLADRIVAVSGRLILVSELGSVIGPLIGASIMARFGIDGLRYFVAAVALLLALVAGTTVLMAAGPPHLERPFEILAPQAAPLAHDALGNLPHPHPTVSA
jgi:hypothetical protein